MEEDKLDAALRQLSIAQSSVGVDDAFRDAMWQRVGELAASRDRWKRTMLGTAVIAVSLGTGLGTAVTPAMAEATGYGLYSGSELAPSSLLHLPE